MTTEVPMTDLIDLKMKHCKPCEGGTPPLEEGRARALLGLLPGWKPAGAGIERSFTFKNHYETMAFVNAVAFISHREDHHPTLEVGYKTCRITYSTHAVGGLSENDFICAAKVNGLLDA
jgi:4a-hydroxytetrahydrobiopterin dehydratase